MAVKLPLVLTAGQIEQLQAGDTISTGSGGLSINQHVLTANFLIPAGYASTITRYVEVASGVYLEIGADGDLEVG